MTVKCTSGGAWLTFVLGAAGKWTLIFEALIQVKVGIVGLSRSLRNKVAIAQFAQIGTVPSTFLKITVKVFKVGVKACANIERITSRVFLT